MGTRNNFFDSLKFILIFLVVLGHTIEKDATTDHNKSILYCFIYTFHMPLFIFISGYFSKNITWKKYKKKFKSIILTYFVFQTIYSIYYIVQKDFSFWKFLTEPASVLWYLIGLLFWRFIIALLAKFNISGLILLLVSLLISFGLFFLPNKIPLIRIFSFFPFFILGYYCTKDIIQKIRNLNKVYTLTFSLVFIIFLYYFTSEYYAYTLFGETIYTYYPTLYTSLFYKIIAYIFPVLLSICFINLVSDKFHKLGSKTMNIYLLHPIFVMIYYTISKIWDINLWVIGDILVASIIIHLSILLSPLKLVQYLINPILLFQKRVWWFLR